MSRTLVSPKRTSNNPFAVTPFAGDIQQVFVHQRSSIWVEAMLCALHILLVAENEPLLFRNTLKYGKLNV
ncbi:MAG TPA: hypothetical protein VEJ47_11245 [Candidatus Eremiobacteraceae bacterium]|nr:hypothetical protein [Candidatus Eremiobacteraceae bacterium]